MKNLKIVHTTNENGWSRRLYATEKDIAENPYAKKAIQAGHRVSEDSIDNIFDSCNWAGKPPKRPDDVLENSSYPDAERVIDEECIRRFGVAHPPFVIFIPV
jgi:hypothetical protein